MRFEVGDQVQHKVSLSKGVVADAYVQMDSSLRDHNVYRVTWGEFPYDDWSWHENELEAVDA